MMSSVSPFAPRLAGDGVGRVQGSTGQVVEFAKRGARGPELGKMRAAGWWSGLIGDVYVSREACAADMGVSFQTACNWFDGLAGPQLHHFLRGWELWPDQMQAGLLAWAGGGMPVRGRRAG